VQVEWGRQFRRSLGRVHLDRRLVRLSVELAAAPIAVLHEVLCHEVAHLAARDLHGRHCQPHGPEWMTLVRTAGFEPRRRIPWSAPSAPSRRTPTRRRRYIHHCPVCQLQRIAWRPAARCRYVNARDRFSVSLLQPGRRSPLSSWTPGPRPLGPVPRLSGPRTDHPSTARGVMVRGHRRGAR
jgi:predicted SprT family Zn-dependent metalloprotease